MKICYWNIGKFPTSARFNKIEQFIVDNDPDVFCLSEGILSIANCNTLETFVNTKGYDTYYLPTFYSGPIINQAYRFNKSGLKVFVKNSLSLSFGFGDQQLEGRIIFIAYKDYLLFLVHGMSMVGDDLSRSNFVVELSNFVKTKSLLLNKNKVIIMGDFNIEPWESELLSNKKYIYSHFYLKKFNLHKNENTSRIYYNPVLEYIQMNSNKYIAGTFYNKTFISILDFALISREVLDYDFNIIDQIGGIDLVTKARVKYSLKYGFDHLPIKLELK